MNNAVLRLTEQFFLRLNMHTALIPWDRSCAADDLDLGLRKAVMGGAETVLLNAEAFQEDLPKEHTLCMAADRFRCHYLFIPVPDQEIPVILKAGPYLTAAIGGEELEGMFGEKVFISECKLFLTQYYSTLPRFENDNFIEDYLYALAGELFGEGDFEIHHISQAVARGGDCAWRPREDQSQDLADRMAQRYELEDRMMDAIARGDAGAAVRCLSSPAFSNPDIRTSVPLRSFMNYTIILNTLCRKAAQRGGVHPIYLDDISRKFAVRIESASNRAQIQRVMQDMLRGYALLVQSRSTGGYSPAIQDVINYIHMHYMDGELTLAHLASFFSMNKSYLSALFKKETGTTLTAFINEYRMEQAVYLLNTSNGSVQSIATACGIPDLAYFSRLFKRSKGMAPTEYRKMVADKD